MIPAPFNEDEIGQAGIAAATLDSC
jgi:hypothetical protein